MAQYTTPILMGDTSPTVTATMISSNNAGSGALAAPCHDLRKAQSAEDLKLGIVGTPRQFDGV